MRIQHTASSPNSTFYSDNRQGRRHSAAGWLPPRPRAHRPPHSPGCGSPLCPHLLIPPLNGSCCHSEQTEGSPCILARPVTPNPRRHKRETLVLVGRAETSARTLG